MVHTDVVDSAELCKATTAFHSRDLAGARELDSYPDRAMI
jgi:hypothetical protein